MSLYQTSVLKKHLLGLDQQLIEKKYKEFFTYFGNNDIQQNIRESKEEEFQEGFIRELFVKIFDYTLKPQLNYNIVLEKKNVDDSKKADGAIIKDDKVVAVIELKSTQTTDLDNVENQAFNYKNHHPGCKYVIISNFEKIRIYIEDATDHIEFDLFNMSRERFEILWLYFNMESVLKDIPLKIKEASVLQEEDVTKKLYADYSKFRTEIFNNIVKNNTDHDKLVLFKKTQKLLDRFLFIFFAEDRLLLPPNSISEIVKQWTTLKDDLDEYVPLYSRFKKYFGYLNTGHKGKQHDIFAYNGGLFAPDEILDNINIDDEILKEHTVQLSKYDFETDVDVNILGHIFEHSLGEIENIQAEIEGEEVDKEKTKRKKDGIFYTPKYITKYIVDNTIGKLCNDKKKELGVIDEEYAKGRKNRKKDIVKELDKRLTDYREWLLNVTILDPACGSGAFLNQALEFLINEHTKIDELKAQLLGGSIVFQDIESRILENNIYGVDLNDESVEIAKLSLWLRTAQKGRKLTTLSNHIKCGNSLISDPEIAGVKAFNWEEEFPEIFNNGGFDVVIGNPPYLRLQGLKDAYPELTRYYEHNYSSATGNYDIYVLFMEKAFKLINSKGVVSFILPHKFLISEFGEGIRRFLKEQNGINSILHFEENLVFEVTTYTCIIKLDKGEKKCLKFKYINPTEIISPFDWEEMNLNNLTEGKWNLQSENVLSIFRKLEGQPRKLEELINVFSGIQTSGDDIYIIEGVEKNGYIYGFSKELKKEVQVEKNIVKPIIKGNNIKRYSNPKNYGYVIFPYEFNDGKAELLNEEIIHDKYPMCYAYLKENELKLRSRENNKMNKEGWYGFVYPKNLFLSNQVKLVSPDITLGLNVTKDNQPYCLKNGAYGIVFSESADGYENLLLCILNSSLLWFFLKNTGNILRGGYFRFNTQFINPFPVPNFPKDSTFYDREVQKILSLNNEFNKLIDNFSELIIAKFDIKKLSKKMQIWYELTFKEFLKELKKEKVKLSISDESEWLQFFNEQKEKVGDLKGKIVIEDKIIDEMVYKLYGLTDEEIKIVEESIS